VSIGIDPQIGQIEEKKPRAKIAKNATNSSLGVLCALCLRFLNLPADGLSLYLRNLWFLLCFALLDPLPGSWAGR
jgi:hypothetical protein